MAMKTPVSSMNYLYDANGRQTFSYRTDGTNGASSVYDCAGQRVQTNANGVTRTMVYDVFGQLVSDYLGSGSTLERENIYRGGQLLAVYETGASCFKSIAQFVSDFYQGAGISTSSSDPAWQTILTQAQAQGQGQLIVAAQNLGNWLFTSSAYNTRNPDIPANRGQFVTDLYAAYLDRAPDGYGYQAWLNALNNGSSREDVRHGFAYSQEFQNDVGQLCVTMTNSGINYVLPDLQGSTRAVMSNGTYGSSTVIARHDYLPFGEEVWSGTGMRSSSQGYGTTDRNRQKYGMTERDDATGLDHTWWRKYESTAGRWTSPDPLGGSIGDPQSFNHYTYAANDPGNLVDPSGLIAGPGSCGYYDAERGFWVFTPCPDDDFYMRFLRNSKFTGLDPQKPRPCARMADFAGDTAVAALVVAGNDAYKALPMFDEAFAKMYLGKDRSGRGRPIRSGDDAFHYSRRYHGATANRTANDLANRATLLGQTDFLSQFKEISNQGDSEDQTHHFAAYFSLGINGGSWKKVIAKAMDTSGADADQNLAEAAYNLGKMLRDHPSKLRNIDTNIRNSICDDGIVGPR